MANRKTTPKQAGRTENPKPDTSDETQSTSTTGKADKKNADAIEILTQDHRRVEKLFDQYDKATEGDKKRSLVERICEELTVHTHLEERVFYPACRKGVGEKCLDEAQVEHDTVKVLIAELSSADPKEDAFYDAKVKVLSEYVKHHVSEEEKPDMGIFAAAKKAGLDLAELGNRLTELKGELESQAEGSGLEPSKFRSFVRQKDLSQQQPQEYEMPRQSTPDRDQYGRFVSEDDHRGYRGYDDDDNRYRSRQSRQRRDYDDEGDREDYRYQSRSRSSQQDYPSRSSRDYDRDRGQGGWFGDPEGHSEAARRGWETGHDSQRRSDRDYDYRSDRQDDDRYASRGRSYYRDDEGGGGSRHYGSRDRNDDRDYDSRSRGYRDDDRQGRSGQGGWFGDSEGHSEAARRGWRNR